MFKIGPDRFLNQQIPGLLFEKSHHLVFSPKPRKSFLDFTTGNPFKRQSMGLCAGLHTRDQKTIRRAHLEQTHLVQQRLAGLLFKIEPALIRFAEERNVIRMFKIGLANNPRLSVGAPLIVGRMVSIDSEHTRSARR